ncbi:MAG TPA: alkaline phosphatase family protein [Candidatus Eisenbacteria bacterium]|nr:alkaline phosphatase family protein [Candidatus Eisenbacteria bacterium]
MKMNFSLKSAAALLAAASLVSPAFANEGNNPKGMPHLDHIFFIMMENHGYQQVIGNPNEPYLNSIIKSGKVNLATNYFAVGHPSLTNYLEVVGGSNFGVRSDNSPDWGNPACQPNIVAGTVNADGPYAGYPNPPQGVKLDPNPDICPIYGYGKDADTPAVDNWNEIYPEANVFYLADLDGVKSVPAAPTVGKSIGDQLAEAGMSWKAYEESLPLGGAYGVNNSNGTVSNLTDFTNLPGPLTSYTALYAVKHNPFAYFRSVQQGYQRNSSMKNVVGFDGQGGLYADLASGDLPTLSFIAPNQCNDQHGKGGESAYCAGDPGSNGLLAGLNPGLIQQGDASIQRLVESIEASPVWKRGKNAIIIVWDENDYSGIESSLPAGTLYPSQNQNRVVLTVETSYGKNGVQSQGYYNSFSLLKTMESAFGLPCLNHACDAGTNVMSDLFGGSGNNHGDWW